MIDGPFVETKELVAGYWVWNVKSMDEAVAWAKQCPNPMPGEEGVLEIRPTYSEAEYAEFVGRDDPADHPPLVRDIKGGRRAKSKAKRPASKRKPARARAKK
jgi:hypothetical protein